MAATILEIPEVRNRVSPLTVAEYHRLGEFNENGRRTELIRGIVIEKMSKSPLHSTIVALLYRLLLTQVGPGLVVRQEQPLTLADSEPEPDIAIVRGDERQFAKSHPTTAELVIEVALASAVLDRENASLYAEANVAEYWIVLGKEKQVEAYRRPVSGRYQEHFLASAHDLLQCLAVPTIHLRFSELLERV